MLCFAIRSMQTARRLHDPAGRVDDRQRRRRNPFGGQLALNLRPERQLARMPPSTRPAVSFSASTVGIQTILQPAAPRNLDRDRIQPADAVIERQGAERPIPGTAFVTTCARSPVWM